VTVRRVRLVFKTNHPNGKEYFIRVTEESNGNRGEPPIIKPLVSPIVSEGAVTFAEGGIRARDVYRGQGFNCWLEDTNGERVFESAPPTPAVEAPSQHRTCFFEVLQGGVPRGNGYIVRYNPLPGKGWYIRASDVPSLVETNRHEVMETLWGSSPEDVVQRLLQTWTAKVAVPFANPLNVKENAAANAQITRANQHPRSPGVRR
jgi:hypothetical protein